MSEHNHTDYPPVDQHILDLINAGVDGEVSPSEQQELEAHLAGSEQLRDLHEDLVRLTRLLDQAPVIDPPLYLQSAIERQIRLPSRSKTRAGIQDALTGWFTSHWLRSGLSLAAGVVLTIGVYKMGSQPLSTQDSSAMAGTVVKWQSGHGGESLGSVLINTDTLSSSVDLHRAGNYFTLDIEMKSDGPSQLLVNFAGRGLEFDSINPSQGFEDAVAVANGSVSVSSSGTQHFKLKFIRTTDAVDDAPLELTFFTDNELVQAAELSLSR